jgi:hypothetical protein
MPWNRVMALEVVFKKMNLRYIFEGGDDGIFYWIRFR